MKYFIIAGEASGDLHASNLAKELKVINSSVEIKGFGGDLMQNEGVQLITHYKELAVMGVVDVLKKVWSIRRIFKKCQEEIERFKPDGIILIDFSGFNLRIAKWAHDKGYKIHYYIAPQIWASRG
jgi:lipid-A-disaccharide synthase